MNENIKTFIKTTVFLFFFLATNSAFGFGGSKGVAEAQKFVDVGRTDRAIEILRDWTNKEAKDFEAYWMLASLYMQRGAYGQAEEQFGYALNLKPNKQGEVTEKFKNAFRHEVASGNIYGAKSMAQRVINFEPAYKQQVYTAFYNKGRTSSGQVAVDNFEAALVFASTQIEREKIGKNFLKLALENSQSEYLINKAINILGKNFVDQVMPSKASQAILTNTYTDANLGADGKVVILDFTKTKIIPGDVLNIYTTVSNRSGNVKAYFNDGKQFTIPNNGSHRREYESGDPINSGGESISFTKECGITVRVEVVRTIEKKTDYTRLGGI